MNEIIRKIEAEQMKENAPEFNVGAKLRFQILPHSTSVLTPVAT